MTSTLDNSTEASMLILSSYPTVSCLCVDQTVHISASKNDVEFSRAPFSGLFFSGTTFPHQQKLWKTTLQYIFLYFAIDYGLIISVTASKIRICILNLTWLTFVARLCERSQAARQPGSKNSDIYFIFLFISQLAFLIWLGNQIICNKHYSI